MPQGLIRFLLILLLADRLLPAEDDFDAFTRASEGGGSSSKMS
jgi:hypothetical protein